MAIKIGLGAFNVPAGGGIPRAAGVGQRAAAAPKVLVWRAPAAAPAKGSNIFQPRLLPQQSAAQPRLQLPGQSTARVPVPQRVLPQRPAESQLPSRPVGPVEPQKPSTGIPQRQSLKQPTFGNWPKAAAATPAASADAPAPTTEQAVTTAPSERTVGVAEGALQESRGGDAGGAYVDTTSGSGGGGGGGEILSAAEEAAVTAEATSNSTAEAIKAAGSVFDSPLKIVGGIAFVVAGFYVWRRVKNEADAASS